VLDAETKIKQKESDIEQRSKEVENKEEEVKTIKESLNKQLELVSTKTSELEKSEEEHVKKLEKIAKLSAKDAKEDLIKALEKDAKSDAITIMKEITDEAKEKAEKEAKKIIIQTIQRIAHEETIDNTVSVFNLESDDQKGQIIGKEGRNIKALEKAAGVEVVVDETPDQILLSGFDPVRREIAKVSLKKLVADGRIHPARIEEVVAKTTKNIEKEIMEIGERTVIDLGISGMHSELVRMVGRMRFRSSYGQNLLQHSVETANLCATMAAEININVKLAKRAGLLHDIGKVSEDEPELSHAMLGMKLAEKHGEHEAVCNAIGAHHDEIDMKFAISPITQACDAISGARPGARRESSEAYIKRLQDLENIAMQYPGVEKSYAIHAGRELRIIVEADKISDKESAEMSFSVAKKIEEEMTFPGQVKVTVIRETRAVSTAK